MINDIMLYIGSIIIILWGVGHIIPTKSIVNNFGPITEDNKRIITMEWVAEGLTLCFMGLLVLVVTTSGGSTKGFMALVVYRAAALMLLILAGLSLLTGARTSILPMKICPVVKTSVAILFFLGSVL